MMARMPAARVGSSPKECHCYSCNGEVLAEECSDLELRCLQCAGTYVERLERRLESTPARRTQADAAVASSATSHQTPPRHQGMPWRRRLQGPIEAFRGAEGGSRGAEAPRHSGVICDGCHERDFAGVRHRCLRCPDFDLCARCHSRRFEIHPDHPFETIRTPRSAVPSLVADFMARAATRTVVAIIEVGLEDAESRSGLDDNGVAWWLADDARLVSVDWVAAQEPTWACAICSDGFQAESVNGWLVRICTNASSEPVDSGIAVAEEAAGAGCCAGTTDCPDNHLQTNHEGPAVTSTAGTAGSLQGHVYHEACLRRWLLKRNSCPICRRAPVVPES
mmetsp:Transcript_31416/g.68837  ORF Transcript_31416/g.68837 Transcript_31416/m.68837 type:complete len:336 (-) Transcript_31416:62-1069(-)